MKDTLGGETGLLPRVLMVTVDFLPRIGGIATMIHHLANALVDRGADVAVLAPKGAALPRGFRARYRLIVDEMARTGLREGSAARAEDQRVRTLLEKVQAEFPFTRLLLMHPFYYGPGAIRYGRRNEIGVSATFYGYELRSVLVRKGRLLPHLQQRLSRKSLRSRTLALARDADEVLAISEYTARLVRSTRTRKPVRVTGCGIAESDWRRESTLSPRFDRPTKRLRRREAGLSEDPTVLFVGRLVPSKNVKLFIEALAGLSAVQGIIVGNGPQRDELENSAKLAGMAKRLRWIADAAEERKWELMRAADILCLPSRELPEGQVEGFGIVLLEAAAAGTPVIAAQSGGMPDVVSHGETGLLCDPDRSADLMRQITRLLSDDQLSEQCVARARRQIKERFNWERIAEDLLAKWKEQRPEGGSWGTKHAP